jgi:hypothetical protein
MMRVKVICKVFIAISFTKLYKKGMTHTATLLTGTENNENDAVLIVLVPIGINDALCLRNLNRRNERMREFY